MIRLLQLLLCRKTKKKFLFFFFLLIFFFLLMNLTYSGGYHTFCTDPRHNLMYIKMIKCASETLSSVFRRYAYTRDLSIVLPIGDKIYLGWPHKMDHHSYRPAKTAGFNFLVDHAVYDDVFMTNLMPENTAFVTSIREPYSQFKSMFNYYQLALNSNMSYLIMDQVTEYLQNINKYEAQYKSHEMSKLRYCIPDGFSMSRNLMSFNLGFAAGKPDGAIDSANDQGSIQHFLASLESKFKLVMIVEHFDESMVLLRRIMCWEMKDILYNRKNVGQYVVLPERSKRTEVEEANIKVYKEWSSVDYQLYEHFQTIFWKKVNNEGYGFYSELRYYQKINRVVNRFCKSIQSGTLEPYHTIIIEKSAYGKSFVVGSAFCKLLSSTLMEEAKKHYDKLPGKVHEVEADNYFC